MFYCMGEMFRYKYFYRILTRNTNIWTCVESNMLDIFPYQSCLSRANPYQSCSSRAKSISVLVVMFTSIPSRPQKLSSSLLSSHGNRFMSRSNVLVTSQGPTTILHSLRKRNRNVLVTLVSKGGFVVR